MRTTLLLALALVALSLPAGANECTPGRTEPDLDTDPFGLGAGPRYYVVDDGPSWCCLVNVWVYEETNGIDGLQRQDELRDDTCNGIVPGDTLVF